MICSRRIANVSRASSALIRPRALRQRANRHEALRCHAVAVEDELDSVDGELCAPAFVTCDNSPEATKLSVRVLDYQGLLHVISWVLKGMEVRVRGAEMEIEDGMADDVFELTTLSGKPLSDARAADVVERVRELVTFCTPQRARKPVSWRSGSVHVCNKTDASVTTVTVLESTERIGFLLEIVSVLCGIGVDVKGATVHTCSDCGDDSRFKNILKAEHSEMEDGRIIQLRTQSQEGKQLSPQTVDAVLFTLNLVLGKGHADTQVPALGQFVEEYA